MSSSQQAVALRLHEVLSRIEDHELIKYLSHIKQLCMILDLEDVAIDNLTIVKFALQTLDDNLARSVKELTGHEF